MSLIKQIMNSKILEYIVYPFKVENSIRLDNSSLVDSLVPSNQILVDNIETDDSTYLYNIQGYDTKSKTKKPTDNNLRGYFIPNNLERKDAKPKERILFELQTLAQDALPAAKSHLIYPNTDLYNIDAYNVKKAIDGSIHLRYTAIINSTQEIWTRKSKDSEHENSTHAVLRKTMNLRTATDSPYMVDGGISSSSRIQATGNDYNSTHGAISTNYNNTHVSADGGSSYTANEEDTTNIAHADSGSSYTAKKDDKTDIAHVDGGSSYTLEQGENYITHADGGSSYTLEQGENYITHADGGSSYTSEQGENYITRADSGSFYTSEQGENYITNADGGSSYTTLEEGENYITHADGGSSYTMQNVKDDLIVVEMEDDYYPTNFFDDTSTMCPECDLWEVIQGWFSSFKTSMPWNWG